LALEQWEEVSILAWFGWNISTLSEAAGFLREKFNIAFSGGGDANTLRDKLSVYAQVPHWALFAFYR